jgi:hypothetical protein
MALVLKDRVKETSTTAGTGTLTLAGAAAGFQSFAEVGNGNTTYYAIVDPIANTWEVGIGTYTSSGTTLSRTTVLSSSAGGALVSFAANSKDVFVTYPAEQGVWVDASGNVVQNTFSSLTVSGAAVLGSGTVNAVPAVGTDIANKAYVDTVATGLTVHEPVYVATTGTGSGTTYADGGTTPTWTTITSTSEIATGSAHGLSAGDVIVFGSTTNGLTAGYGYFVKSVPTSTSITLSLILDGPTITTLTNGTGLSITSRANAGVGATITSNSVGTLTTIDNVAVTVGNRVLVHTWTNAYANGVYDITSVGSGATPWVLTRSANENTYHPTTDTQLGAGDYFFVQNGDTYRGDSFVVGTPGTIIFGTTNISFNLFANSVVYSAGTGLTLTDTTFSITNTAVSANTYGSASQVPVFAVNAQGQLTSVTNTAIAINGSAVSGAISGQAGSVANALTAGTYLTSGGTFDGSAARTFAVDATSANTASKVVARDSSGNFSAGTVTAALSGNATTATTATNVASGAANQIVFNTASGTTSFVTAPTTGSTFLSWSGSAFAWSAITTPNSVTFNSSGSGDASGTTFNGGTARTISYNTVGASPLAGSSSITTVGTITSGVWNGTAIGSAYGGMVYPGSGIPVSTGSAWTTSKASPSGVIVGTTDSQTLTNKQFQAYNETVTTVGTVATATYNIDLSLSNIFDITLGTNVTFTFTNPPSSGISKNCTVILRQDATGSRLATFTNAKYTDGTAPILSTGANQIDVLTFFTVNGGSFWFGTFAMANVS